MPTDVIDVLPGGGAARTRSDYRFQLALEAGKLGAWEFDTRTRALTSSAQCKANHGLPPDADLQLEADLIPAIDSEHRARFRDAIDTAIATGGSFEIEVPHTWPDGTRHWLLVTGLVVDQGCMVGVSRDVTGRFFNRFVQVGSSRYRQEGGLGIGLALVRVVVGLHGGRVTAHSDGIGAGSEFVVRLPLPSQI
jgi:light-regulated signal transduction histidine kinase (bacteriophytochrome)